MLSICIPSISIQKARKSLFFINKQLKDFSLIKEIEICVHINGLKTNFDEIFKDFNHEVKKQFSNTQSKTVFQESYYSAVKLATQKFLIVIGDTDRLIDKNIEKLLIVLKEQKKAKMTYISDNTSTSFELSPAFVGQKLIELNIKNFEKFFMPLTPTFIGNVIFDNNFLKTQLFQLSDFRTEYPHVLPYLNSLFNSSSAYFTEPTLYPDNSPRVWGLLQDRLNSFDLMRVYVLALKSLSVDKLSFYLFKIPFYAIRSLPKAILKEIYFFLIKKKYPYQIKQPFFEVVMAYHSFLIIFIRFFINKFKKRLFLG
tara:strand:- start:974 stop:1909 length:936 start_codon:yes stop_codon:yes gene_type:complete